MAKIAIAMIAQEGEEEEEAPALHSATAAAIYSLSLSRGQTRSPNLVSPFASVQGGRTSRKEKILILILILYNITNHNKIENKKAENVIFDFFHCIEKYVINCIISIKIIILKVNSNMELAIH